MTTLKYLRQDQNVMNIKKNIYCNFQVLSTNLFESGVKKIIKTNYDRSMKAKLR